MSGAPPANATAGGPPPGAAAGGPPSVSEEIDMNAPGAAFFPPVSPEEFALLPHDNQGPHCVAANWVLVALAFVFLALRMYCKLRRGGRLWWDDYVLILSFLLIVASACIITVMVSVGGYGKHVWDVGQEYTIGTIIDTFLQLNVNSTLSTLASVWSKTSFALTLLKLSKDWVKVAVWAIIATTNVIMVFAAILPWIRCDPASAAWNFLEAGPGVCWSTDQFVAYNTFATAYSAAMDMALAFLPWCIIWGLQMRRVEKFGVGVAMSCGVFAAAITIVKAVKARQASTFDPAETSDLLIWATTEVSVTIVAATIPVLRVLLRDIHSTARKYYLSRTGGTAKGSQPSQTGGVSTSKSYFGSRWGKSQVTATAVTVTQKEYRSSDGGPTSPDTWSGKSILEDAAPTGKIKRTQEVNIEYGRGDSDYEMGDVGRNA